MSKQLAKPNTALAKRRKALGLSPNVNVPVATMDLLATIQADAQKAGHAAPVELSITFDPDAADAPARHGQTLAALAYARYTLSVAAGSVGPVDALVDGLTTGGPAAIDAFVASAAPRDGIEAALTQQIALAHARSIWVQTKLLNASTAEGITTLSELADRAANTFRRLAIALSEYRAPRRTVIVSPKGDIVQNQNFGNDFVTNEQGPRHASLSHDPGRPALPSADHPCYPTLDAIHRPADASGEASILPQQFEARPAVRRRRATAKDDNRAAAGDPGSTRTTKRTILKTQSLPTAGHPGKGTNR